MRPEFSSDWLTSSLPYWEKVLDKLKGKPNLRFLEIGSFEGRSACWLLENIVTDPTSTLTCVDSFEPFDSRGYKAVWPEHVPYPFPDILHIEERFDENIRRIGAVERVIKHKAESWIALRSLPLNTYDCIYVDGCHRPQDVLRDIILSWDLLKDQGVLILDDYLLFAFNLPYDTPRFAIDAFMTCFNGQYECVSKGWQMMLRKTNSPTEATTRDMPAFMQLALARFNRHST